MIDVKMFRTVEELKELTGLDNDGLWSNGFNLDDWDVGFQCDKELPDGWLIWQMESYCAGYMRTDYDGKIYYMVYHD